MAVKKTPKLYDIRSFHPKSQERIRAVAKFIDDRGSKPTRYEDVARYLNIGFRSAWVAVDRAWNCGLITKVIRGNSCHWIRLSPRGYVIDQNE